MEIDPRALMHDQVEALIAAGMTRASIGIQDFNPKVQQAINREQSFAVTKAVVDTLRMAGVDSVMSTYSTVCRTRARGYWSRRWLASSTWSPTASRSSATRTCRG